MIIRDIAIAFGYQVDEKSEKKVNDSVDKIKSVATKALGAIGIGFSLIGMNSVIEEFGKINSQIKNATKNLSDQKDIQNKIMAAANESRSAYADIANFTSKLVQASPDLFDVEQAAKYMELTTKLFKSENKSQSELLGLQEAINKSFSKGAVDSETINQILERSPVAADMLAKSLGAARTDLAKMASDGKISLTQLRDVFLNNSDSINAAFANVDMTISDALVNVRNQWGLWLTQMDKTAGVTNNISKAVTRTFSKIMNGLRKVQVYMERLSKAVGGADNMFKLLTITAGAIFVALNAGKILAFLKTLRTLLTVLNFKILAIVAVIALVALAVDDFINFMQGNESVIGEIFKKWGIDADGVRQSIIQAWEKVEGFLVDTWDAIKDVFKGVIEFITGVFTNDWDRAFKGLESAVDTALGYIEKVLSSLVQGLIDALPGLMEATGKIALMLIKAILGALPQFVRAGTEITLILGKGIIKAIPKLIGMVLGHLKALFPSLTPIFDGAKKHFEIAFKAVGRIFENIVIAIRTVFNIFKALFTGDWKALWEEIKILFSLAWDNIKAVFEAVFDILGNVLDIFAGIFKAIWNSIADFFVGIWDELVAVVESAIEDVKSMFTAAVDFFKDAWNGVTSFFAGIWDGMVNTVASAVEKITALLSPMLDTIGKTRDAISNVKGVVGGAVSKAAGILGFAKGTENTPDSFIAGEKGPELITGAKGKKVFTASKTSGILGAIGDALKTVNKAVSVLKEATPKSRREPVEEIKAVVTVNAPKPSNNISDILNKATTIIADKFPKIKKEPDKTGTSGKISPYNVIDEENDTEDVKALKRKAQKKELSGNKKSFSDIAAAIKSVGNLVSDSSRLVAENVLKVKETADKSGMTDALKSFGSDILTLAKSATVSPGTVQSMVTSTTNRSVTQNNHFENTFNGGERAAQKRGSETMSKNAEDATGALARALAYAR